ncbi:hypothetical protein HK24_06845 [Gluconobacter sp. DsW_058]|nr:hypothetical protein HK24_06845 [Gluconobacter sp. DsW_058]
MAQTCFSFKARLAPTILPAFHGIWVFSVGDGKRMPCSMTRSPERLLLCSPAENALGREEAAFIHGDYGLSASGREAWEAV